MRDCNDLWILEQERIRQNGRTLLILWQIFRTVPIFSGRLACLQWGEAGGRDGGKEESIKNEVGEGREKG